MTLNAIEIWNLSRYKGTCKYEMIKNEKQRKIEQVFHEYSGLKKARWIHKVIMMNAKRIFVSTVVRGKNTTWKPVSNVQYNFLNTLCN